MGVKEVRKFKQPQPNTFLSYVKKTTGGEIDPPPPAGIEQALNIFVLLKQFSKTKFLPP